MQDYESLHVAVMICVILVNTQTDTQMLICYTVSSANLAKNDEVLSHIVYSVIPCVTC